MSIKENENMVVKADYAGALIVFFFLIFAISLATYELFQTPAQNIMTATLLWLVLGTMVFMLFSGEFLGHVLLRKNFQDEGGLTGVYLRHEEHDRGMVSYYVSTYKRYATHCDYDDFKEKGIWERFIAMFVRARVVVYTDKASMFEEVPEYASSVPEGCIKYRGTLRKGVKLLSPIASLREKISALDTTISELHTRVMTSTSSSEAAMQEHSKNISDAAVIISNAVNNFDRITSPPQKEEK